MHTRDQGTQRTNAAGTHARTNHFFHCAGLGEPRPQVRPDSHRREEALEQVSTEARNARPASRMRRRLFHERQVFQHQLVLWQEEGQEKNRGVIGVVTRAVGSIREALTIHICLKLANALKECTPVSGIHVPL